jgi:hypothetical protein
MKVLLLALVLVLIGFPAYAQTGTMPNSYDVNVYLRSQPAGSPPQSVVGQTTNPCGVMPKLPASPTIPVNPTRVRIDDPTAPSTTDCEFLVAARVSALPDGDYDFSITAKFAAPVGNLEGPRVPFVRRRPALPPAAPTGTRALP